MFACFLLSKQKEASKEKQNKKKVKNKMEKTNYQENRIQQQEQQQKQELFDSETKRKIKDSLQEIYNKQQLQQQATNVSGRKGSFIKFVHDGEHKRLSLTGQFQKEQVPYKDFITNQVTEGKFSERYFFECYDITDSNHPSEISTWERGPKDAKTILYWLSNDKNVLDVIRHGLPGSKTTTYDIHPSLMD
jgi:hypothetical protein